MDMDSKKGEQIGGRVKEKRCRRGKVMKSLLNDRLAWLVTPPIHLRVGPCHYDQRGDLLTGRFLIRFLFFTKQTYTSTALVTSLALSFNPVA